MARGRRGSSYATRALMVLIGMLFASGCDGQAVGFDHLVLAVVRGAVLDSDGVGVQGAAVTVRAHHDDQCSGEFSHQTALPVMTDIDGSFFVTFDVPLTPPFRACLVTRADPPLAAALLTDSVSGVFVDFVLEGSVLDTAVVNVVLRAP